MEISHYGIPSLWFLYIPHDHIWCMVIETGKTNGDFIEVTKNLDANVEVILEGARSVNNGQVVKVINKK